MPKLQPKTEVISTGRAARHLDYFTSQNLTRHGKASPYLVFRAQTVVPFIRSKWRYLWGKGKLSMSLSISPIKIGSLVGSLGCLVAILKVSINNHTIVAKEIGSTNKHTIEVLDSNCGVGELR
jgi:hypothetical protein